MFDVAVVNVAFPDILSDFEITRSDGSWMVSYYSIFFGSLLLLAGTTADSVNLHNAELIFSNWSNTTYLGRQSISRSRRCRYRSQAGRNTLALIADGPELLERQPDVGGNAIKQILVPAIVAQLGC